MHQHGDRTGTSRVTVKQAAEIMGLTPEAVRARLFRGTLERETGEDGTVWVILRPGHTQPDGDHAEDQSHEQTMLVEHLDSEVEFLRAELRQQVERHADETRELRRLIAGLIERIPELPAATVAESPRQWAEDQDHTRQESREKPPQSPDETRGSVHDQEGASGPQQGARPRSLWRRIFG